MNTDRLPANPLLVALRRWPVVVLTTLGVGLGAFAVAQSPPSTYEAVAVVSFLPVREYQADLLRLTLPRYQAYASSTDRLRQVADELGLDERKVRDAVEVRIPAESPNITITVTTTSPRQSAAIANRLAELTESFADADGVLRSANLQRAQPAREPSGPPRTLITAAGLLAGLAMGGVLAYLIEARRPRVRTRVDLEAIAAGRRVEIVPDNASIDASPMEDPELALAAIRLGHSLTEMGVGETEGAEPTVAVVAPTVRAGATSIARLLAHAVVRDGRSVTILELSDALVAPRPAAVGAGEGVPRAESDDEPDGGAEPTAETEEPETEEPETEEPETEEPETEEPETEEPEIEEPEIEEPQIEEPEIEEPETDRSFVVGDRAEPIRLLRWADISGGATVTTDALREHMVALAKEADVVVVDVPPPDAGEVAVIALGAVSMTAVVVPRRGSMSAAVMTLELADRACPGPVILVGNRFAVNDRAVGSH
jgi:hypothetical protein